MGCSRTTSSSPCSIAKLLPEAFSSGASSGPLASLMSMRPANRLCSDLKIAAGSSVSVMGRCYPSGRGRYARRGRASEHPVVVPRLGGDRLQDVPVLDDPAGLVEAEDVDPGVVLVAGPVLKAVQ